MEDQRVYKNRANETIQESKKRREIEAQRANINRANETPEKRIARKERDAKRAKLTRANVSPESAKKRREKNTERVRKYWVKKKAAQEAHKERLRRQVIKSANQNNDPDNGSFIEEVPNISQYVETRESIIAAYYY